MKARRATAQEAETPANAPDALPLSDGPITLPRPRSLAALKTATNACRACPIGFHATQSVCGEGPKAPTHMMVGEQPGDLEDLEGRPFIGPAGKLLDRAMAEIGWPRETIYVSNAVKHFKFELRGKRRLHKTPRQREAEICAQWLEHEISLVNPEKLVALGATAARSLLGRAVAIGREGGKWINERSDGRPVFVTMHPSALLRIHDETREEVWKLWVGQLKRAMRG